MNIKHRDNYFKNKEVILNCFMKIINEQGYSNTTINKISKFTNLSYGSITNIFSTKEDILLELLKTQIANYSKNTPKKDRLYYFLSILISQFKNLLNDKRNIELYLELFSLEKTSSYIKMHIKNILTDTIDKEMNYQLKAAAIVGIIREYINIFENHKDDFDNLLSNMLESIFLVCEFDKSSSIEKVNTLKKGEYITS